ncbi:hypothetical protein JOC48_003733 [Aquibacillus albus]|uniref:Uncharacterized protein n=1 Tax=Aquibacillus albus TaxID=1168171 RepID=A0ABS2N4Y8_9BACI|nr:hypothetical protein [Aquibacillus albus]
MEIMTKEDLKKTEEYFYLAGYNQWYPFLVELNTKLLNVYGKEPFPHTWIEQDFCEGSKK